MPFPKYTPPSGGHCAPASTIAARTARSRQQLPAARAATVSPPSECPATAILAGSTSPVRDPCGRFPAATSQLITKAMSDGWFARSSSAGSGVLQLVSGKLGAATT